MFIRSMVLFLRALSDAAGADERVEQIYRSLIQDFITATARHICEEQEKWAY